MALEEIRAEALRNTMTCSGVKIVSKEEYQELRRKTQRDVPPYIDIEIMRNIDNHWTFSTEVKWQA